MCWVPRGVLAACLVTLAGAISLQQCNGLGLITVTHGQNYSITCPHTDVTRNVTWAFTSLLDNVPTYVITEDCPLLAQRESVQEPFCESRVPAFQIVRPHFGFTSLRIEWERLPENMTYGLLTCVLDGKTEERCRINLLMEAESSTPPEETTTVTVTTTDQSLTSPPTTAEASTNDLHNESTSSSVTSDPQSGSTTPLVTSDLQSGSTTPRVTSDLQSASTTPRVTSDLESDSPLTSTPTASVSMSSESSRPDVHSTDSVSTSISTPTTTADTSASSSSTTATTTTSSASHLTHTHRVIIIATVIAAAAIIPALIVGVIVCCRWRKRRSLLQSTMSDGEGSLEFHNRLHEDSSRVSYVFHPTSAKGDNSAPSSPTAPGSYIYTSVKKPPRVDPTLPYPDSAY